MNFVFNSHCYEKSREDEAGQNWWKIHEKWSSCKVLINDFFDILITFFSRQMPWWTSFIWFCKLFRIKNVLSHRIGTLMLFFDCLRMPSHDVNLDTIFRCEFFRAQFTLYFYAQVCTCDMSLQVTLVWVGFVTLITLIFRSDFIVNCCNMTF